MQVTQVTPVTLVTQVTQVILVMQVIQVSLVTQVTLVTVVTLGTLVTQVTPDTQVTFSIRILLSSLNAMTFHDFFAWAFPVFHHFRYTHVAVTYGNF